MKLLRNFKMENSKAVTIPLDTGYYKNRNSNDDKFRNEDIYRSAIGALLYLSVNTRPDICVATSILGRNVSDPITYDWSEVKRIMKYLNGTIDMEIKLGKISSDIDEDILYGYADADWAGDRSDRKSNSGYLFKFMGAMFDWRCKKRTCVALSSTEAEFISLSEASQQAIYLKGLLQDFQQDVTTTVMFEENQSCLKLLDNEKKKLKKYNFVKNLKLTNKIMFQYCPSHSMLADFLTKPLGPEKLRNNIEMVGLKLFFFIGFATTMTKAQHFNTSNPPKILVFGPFVPVVGPEKLKEMGCQVIKVENYSKEDILEKVKGVEALFWASHEKLDNDILDAAGSQMKVIGAMSAGYNHIDIGEVKKRGIKLGNTPNVLNDAVADVAILLALAASRRLHEGRLKMENNEWNSHSEWLLGQDMTNSTVGIVGLGGIGQTIVERLRGFNIAQFLYNGRTEKPQAKTLGAKFVSLDTLLKDSDFVMMAVPLTNETEEMCNDDFFSKMKKTAVFVNISRGKVVDQPALIRALKNETIFAAGLDVMTPEPLPPNHELMKLPNLVLLPHLGKRNQTNQRCHVSFNCR
ncbi:hypothetical protein JTB14_026436 [Gonioctena quinquepunctata]|nr:hypothetical protein JTB14_026436 [Gonioctena quinquepunctata]